MGRYLCNRQQFATIDVKPVIEIELIELIRTQYELD